MRTKMAYFEKIKSITPIDDSDFIELAQVLDYYVVVKKGIHKVGDIVVYIEVDSIVPDGLPFEDKDILDKMKKEVGKESFYLIKKGNISKHPELANHLEKYKDIVSRNTIPCFEFLRANNFKIKAIKIRGVISQGIIFKVSDIPMLSKVEPVCGYDLTTILNITRNDYEEDVVEPRSFFDIVVKNKFLMRSKFYRKLIKRIFDTKCEYRWGETLPEKSDETNIQNIFTDIYNKYGTQHIWYCTEKMEGTNVSYGLITSKFLGIFPKKKFFACSHSVVMRSRVRNAPPWDYAIKCNMKDKLSRVPFDVFVRGEIVGPKICCGKKNIYCLDENHFTVFDVYQVINGKYIQFNFEQMRKFCIEFGFEYVPIVEHCAALKPTVEEMLKNSDGKTIYEYANNKKQLREGIVWRLIDDPSVSFKVKSPKYMIED